MTACALHPSRLAIAEPAGYGGGLCRDCHWRWHVHGDPLSPVDVADWRTDHSSPSKDFQAPTPEEGR